MRVIDCVCIPDISRDTSALHVYCALGCGATCVLGDWRSGWDFPVPIDVAVNVPMLNYHNK
jgi:hypothetical protein